MKISRYLPFLKRPYFSNICMFGYVFRPQNGDIATPLSIKKIPTDLLVDGWFRNLALQPPGMVLKPWYIMGDKNYQSTLTGWWSQDFWTIKNSRTCGVEWLQSTWLKSHFCFGIDGGFCVFLSGTQIKTRLFFGWVTKYQFYSLSCERGCNKNFDPLYSHLRFWMAFFFGGGKRWVAKGKHQNTRLQMALHPRKLTCPLKRDYFSREYIFQPLIFRGQPLVFRGVL